MNWTKYILRMASRRSVFSSTALFQWCLLLSAICSLASAQESYDPKRAHQLYEKAQKTVDINNQTELLQQAASLLALDRIHRDRTISASWRLAVNIHYTLGRVFYQQAKHQLAIVHFEKALVIDSTFAEPGDTSRAYLKRSLAHSYHALAIQLMKQGKAEAALHAAEKATQRDSTFWSAYTTQGLTHFQQGHYDAAITAYTKVVNIQTSAQLYNNLGAAYEAKGDLTSAVHAYRRALEIDTHLALTQKNLQRAQEKLAQTESKVAGPVASSGLRVTPEASRPGVKQLDSSTVVSPSAQKIVSKVKISKDKKNKTPNRGEKILVAKNLPRRIPNTGKQKTPQPHLPEKSRTHHITALDNKNFVTAKYLRLIPLSPDTNLRAPLTAKTIGDTVLATAISPLATKSDSPATPHGRFVALVTGLIGLGIFMFAYRHRLIFLWSHFKSFRTEFVLEKSRSMLLLPARASSTSEINNASNTEAGFSTNAAPLLALQNVTEVEPPSAVSEEDEEPQAPSLQTQTLFAEMIAAEPEIDAFDEASAEKPAPETNQAFADIDHSSTPQPLFHPNDETTNSEVEGSAAVSVVAPTAATNKKNGATSSPVTGHVPEHESKTLFQDVTLVKTNNGEHVKSIESLGRYLIEREIGKGAMGKVYLAWDSKLERRVVIKTVCFDLAMGAAEIAALKDRVYREARAIAKLMHPNIVVVYDVEDSKDLSYIVMEHIEGRDLKQALKVSRCFDSHRAIKIVSQVCSALDYAHRAGIFHCDVKPSNIMLLPDDKAKITDFGIAKIADRFSPTLTARILGTPSYMAPEQFEGVEIDGRADIFSLGVVLYELLTGRRPFNGDSVAVLAYKIVRKMPIPPSLHNMELPMEFDEIVGRAMAKRPEERYQTAEEFREALMLTEAAAEMMS